MYQNAGADVEDGGEQGALKIRKQTMNKQCGRLQSKKSKRAHQNNLGPTNPK